MSAKDFAVQVVCEFVAAFDPLVNALDSAEGVDALLGEFGWELQPGTTIVQVQDIIGDIPAVVAQMKPLAEKLLQALKIGEIFDVTEFVRLITLIKTVVTVVNGVKENPRAVVEPFNKPEFQDTFPSELLEYLVYVYVAQRTPRLFSLLRLFGVFKQPDPDPTRPLSYTPRQTRWSMLATLASTPQDVMKEAYGWGEEEFGDAGDRTAGQLFLIQALSDTVKGFGLPGVLAAPSAVDLAEYYHPDSSFRSGVLKLSVPLYQEIRFDEETISLVYLDFSVVPIPLRDKNVDAPTGLAMYPHVQGQLDVASIPLSDGVTLALRGGFETAGGIRLEIYPGTASVSTDLSTALDAETRLTAERPADTPWVLVGRRQSTHLWLAKAHLSLQAHGPTQDVEVLIETAADSAGFVLDFSEGDAFLRNLFGEKPQIINFSTGVRWSSKGGLTLMGKTSLEINIGLHQSIGDVIRLESLLIRVEPGDQDSQQARPLLIQLGLSGTARVEPLKLRLDRVGVEASLAFPRAGGNLGPIDLDIDFKPPTRIGLSINSSGFTGGGFLDFDPANERYFGALELEFQNTIAINAIGLLNTRLPDGSDGFSLLIVLNADLNPPYELGLGFKLSNVGGMLGLNRTADVERLRTGLRDGTLNSVLFPQNVIENANRVISDLEQVFPPHTDRFIFGPMARIVWGTPPLLTIDVGLLIEVPDPVRVHIPGVLKALLPDEKGKVLQLQVNFLGEIDFDAGRLYFDASLFDSKLLGYTLSGDMAVRLIWGADPNFLLTVGGFHPKYRPPPLNLPALRRLSLPLTAGDNPRLRLESYYAITSNTVQFGAKVELYAGAGKFNAYGFLSFDALFQFNPFYFIASLNAKLALRVGSKNIASITLSGTLAGPTPWHVKGTAKLKLCWFITVKVRFDKTFGEKRITTLRDVPVLGLLKKTLAQPGNWRAEPPSGRHLLVSLKELSAADGKIVAHPFGILTISQKVVPLNVNIQKFGSQRPSDGERFSIKQVQVGNEILDPKGIEAVKEQFAPGQFFEIPDAQKLSRKSFEKYRGGIKITDSEKMDAVYAVKRDVEYELKYLPQHDLEDVKESLMLDALAFSTWATQGAIAGSPLSFARRAKSALAPDAVELQQERFIVVNMSDMRPANDDSMRASEAEAHSRMQELVREDPALEGEIQVVPSFEMNAA